MSDKPELDPEDIRVGATIRALREAHGLSAAELGRALGKSEPLISAIERGCRHATPQVRRGIVDTFRVPLAVLTVPNYEDICDANNAAEAGPETEVA